MTVRGPQGRAGRRCAGSMGWWPPGCQNRSRSKPPPKAEPVQHLFTPWPRLTSLGAPHRLAPPPPPEHTSGCGCSLHGTVASTPSEKKVEG
eukprot:5019210-Alexandrium_andersonii.AAC.2